MYYMHSQITIYSEAKEYIKVNDDSIAIFAAHQDDGVIMAGGYAMQAIKKGGRVNVFYMLMVNLGMGEKEI
ncbi:MAG: hypothetical protein HOG49_17230 [Candidatus Scalindua sp.]|jgi:hypothetical protein|nr:hypothetical protein [Candidatus Scalindua sp.]